MTPTGCELSVPDLSSRRLTAGVLTKADTVREGDFEQWRKILNNESHVLRRGYYATRLPGPIAKEMEWTWTEARAAEHRQFSHAPWTQFASRLGIPKLTEALSFGLAHLIEERFIILSLTLTW
jgi:hypothetical protein